MSIYKKFQDHPVAAAAIFQDDEGNTFLRSYNTLVACVDKDGWATCNGTYSATTRKHLGWFAKLFPPMTYQNFKFCYENNVSINVETGEVIDRK